MSKINIDEDAEQINDAVSVSQRHVDLSDEQRAVINAMKTFAADPPNLTFCLHGYAGSGKTTTLSQYAQNNEFATLCTLTGKAASILRRKTGLNAMTIHSYFYRLEEIRKSAHRGREFKWRQAHQQDALANRIVLLDECGMVGQQIVHDILNTGAIIIACGDPGQLEPVGQDAYFTKADLTLQTIHRQALDSPIIRQAHRVRQGLPYEADTENFRVARRVYDEDIVKADILLCWTNTSRSSLNARARSLRGFWPVNPQVGEPLMCLRNYGQAGLFNGAIYKLLEPFKDGDTTICLDVDGVARTIIGVKFQGVENKLSDNDTHTTFTFGYACTVHKAAGSEWENVVLFDEYRHPDGRNRWLYTAITRAAERITIIT